MNTHIHLRIHKWNNKTPQMLVCAIISSPARRVAGLGGVALLISAGGPPAPGYYGLGYGDLALHSLSPFCLLGPMG